MTDYLDAILRRSSQAVEKLVYSLLPKSDSPGKAALSNPETKASGTKAKISPRQKWQHDKAETLTPGTNQSKGVSQVPTASDKSSRKRQNYRISPVVSAKPRTLAPKLLKTLSQEMREVQEKKRTLLEELRQVDHKLKQLKLKDKLTRKPREPQPEDVAEQTKKALELVKKLNDERRKRQLKKQQQAKQLELRAQQSISKIAQMKKAREQRKHQQLKELTEKKEKERHSRSVIRHLNTESDQVIEQMRKHNSVFDLTSVQDEPPKKPLLRKKYPPTHFLETIITEQKAQKRQQEMKQRQKRLLVEKRKSYNTIVDKIRVNRLVQPRQQSIELHYQYEHTPIVAKRVELSEEPTFD